jgi:HAD superfamily hydrolase (TIGR01509 family)
VFDLGKVLLEFDYRIAAGRLAELCDLGGPAIERLVTQTPLLRQYETGELSSPAFFAAFKQAAGFRGSSRDFAERFADIFTPIDPMVQIHAALRARGVPTFLLSNTNEIQARHIRRTFPFFREFDGHVLSFEQGVMKPDPAIYEATEKLAGCCGPDLLFLDDRPENVSAACARRWHGIVHESVNRTRSALQDMGLLDGAR